ncbi:hypothetical protein ACHAWC_011182 [Mediolabrus comicus]
MEPSTRSDRSPRPDPENSSAADEDRGGQTDPNVSAISDTNQGLRSFMGRAALRGISYLFGEHNDPLRGVVTEPDGRTSSVPADLFGDVRTHVSVDPPEENSPDAHRNRRVGGASSLSGGRSPGPPVDEIFAVLDQEREQKKLVRRIRKLERKRLKKEAAAAEAAGGDEDSTDSVPRHASNNGGVPFEAEASTIPHQEDIKDLKHDGRRGKGSVPKDPEAAAVTPDRATRRSRAVEVSVDDQRVGALLDNLEKGNISSEELVDVLRHLTGHDVSPSAEIEALATRMAKHESKHGALTPRRKAIDADAEKQALHVQRQLMRDPNSRPAALDPSPRRKKDMKVAAKKALATLVRDDESSGDESLASGDFICGDCGYGKDDCDCGTICGDCGYADCDGNCDASSNGSSDGESGNGWSGSYDKSFVASEDDESCDSEGFKLVTSRKKSNRGGGANGRTPSKKKLKQLARRSGQKVSKSASKPESSGCSAGCNCALKQDQFLPSGKSATSTVPTFASYTTGTGTSYRPRYIYSPIEDEPLATVSPRLSGKRWRAMMRRRRAFEVWYIGQHDDDRKRAKKLAGRRVYYDRGKKSVSFYQLSLPPSKESFFSEVGKLSFKLAEVSPVELAKTVAIWLEYKAIQAALAPPTSDTKGGSSIVDDDHGWLDSEPTSPFALHHHDPKELDAFVSKLDHPTRLVRNFIGLSPSQHAANVEAAMLRCEIAFHEARSSRVHLEGVEPKTLKEERNDPTFLERYHNIPAIVDTGASHGLTFSRHDFITYEKCHITVKAVGSENTVIGMGIVLYKMRATNGNICLVPGIAYHLPSCNLRLMSPQSYHQTYKGFSQLDGSEYTFFLAPAANGPERHEIRIPINDKSNLPMIFNVSTTGKEKRDAKPFFVNSIRMHQHFSGMFFGTWRTSYDYRDEGEEDEYEFRPLMHLSGKTKMSCLGCLSDDSNPNLSTGQKELLLWHYRLGISTRHVQHLMKEHERKDEEGNVVVIPPVIPAKSADAVKCDPSIRCTTCEIARAKVQRPKVKHQAPRMKEKDKALSKEKYLPGDYVSMDTVPVGVPGRAFDGYGGPHAGKFFTHLTLFHDAGTGIIKVYLQQNETAAATLYSKQQFEDFLWREAGATVKHYHSDQGSNFTSKAFREDCDEKKQSQSFSGTGAKFENANAERAVQTLFWCARTFLLHTALRWDQYGCADTNLWPQAVLYAEWLYNRTPKMTTCMSPMELLTNRRSDHHDLLRAKVFGCPSFVLDASLADGKKIPKFRSRSKVGQFMGFSNQHSSVVGLIRNLSTGSITPQYHVVFDEKFQAVAGLSTSEDDENLELYVQRLWKHLFESPYATDWYAENEVEDGEIVFEVPPLADEWLSEEEIRQKEDRLQAQVRRNQQRIKRYNKQFEEPTRRRAENKVTIRFKDEPSIIDASVDDENSAEDVTPFSFSEGDGDDGNFDSEGAEGTVDDLGRVRRNRGDWKHRFDDTEFVQVAEREFVQQTPSDGSRYVTKHNWQHALSFSPKEFAELSLQEKAVLRSDKLDKEFGHMSVTLMNDRQMTESVKDNPVTWDSIRHPNQKPWMNRAQAKQGCQ